MFYDMLGAPRQKVALHVHTTNSDGRLSPEAALALFRAADYDAVAFTDHWRWNPGSRQDGLTVLSGAEYNCGGNDGAGFVCGAGVYHITAIGCTEEPQLQRGDDQQTIAEAIHRAGGLAVLAHPAWSLNDPSVVAQQNCYDATEIYNTVSGVHASRRPDSSAFVDLLACRGVYLPLIAADDSHFYDNDAAVAWVCVRAEDNSAEKIMDALRRGDFYASQGPEVHLRRQGDTLTVQCSQVKEVYFHSNAASVGARVVSGENLTCANYPIQPADRFVRAEVVDGQSRRAWTNFIQL